MIIAWITISIIVAIIAAAIAYQRGYVKGFGAGTDEAIGDLVEDASKPQRIDPGSIEADPWNNRRRSL